MVSLLTRILGALRAPFSLLFPFLARARRSTLLFRIVLWVVHIAIVVLILFALHWLNGRLGADGPLVPGGQLADGGQAHAGPLRRPAPGLRHPRRDLRDLPRRVAAGPARRLAGRRGGRRRAGLRPRGRVRGQPAGPDPAARP